MAPIIYNRLPKKWRELNANELKIRLKSYLIGRAYYDITEFLEDPDLN